ncbi:hypothetical protein GF338_09250, partial [candidate division WOR-3 bacterium]|nr:hypothetical protein [candidate division WOR-3 bacterium]
MNFRTVKNIFLVLISFSVLLKANQELQDTKNTINEEPSGVFLESSEGSWQTSVTDASQTIMDVTPAHPYAGFVVQEIGDMAKPVIYSFYIISDAHVGGLDGIEDYYYYGWWNRYNPDRPGNTSGPDGAAPGERLNYAHQIINHHYQNGSGEGQFCIQLGDLAQSAEREELYHGRIKLDSLDCPWAIVIGNHDT